jgi:hypothetical protein
MTAPALFCIYPGCVERSRAGVGPALGPDRYCRLCRSATSLRSWALKKHEDRPASPCGGRCVCGDGCGAAGCVRKQQTVVVRDGARQLRASCPGAGRRAHHAPRGLRRKPLPPSPEGARACGPGDRRSRDRRRYRPGREPAGSALPGPSQLAAVSSAAWCRRSGPGHGKLPGGPPWACGTNRPDVVHRHQSREDSGYCWQLSPH